MAFSFDRKLMNAYLDSQYVISDTEEVLIIGRKHPDADHFFDHNNFRTYAWITAWNPYSRPLGSAQNVQRNDLLLQRLGNEAVLRGYSQDSKGNWFERGFWVGNTALPELKKICRDFGQNAFVFAGRAQVLQLILT